MPRVKGQSKCEVENRAAAEGIQFNSLVMAEDLEILDLLLKQEIDRREYPSDALLNSLELVRKLQAYNGQNVKQIETLVV